MSVIFDFVNCYVVHGVRYDGNGIDRFCMHHCVKLTWYTVESTKKSVAKFTSKDYL